MKKIFIFPTIEEAKGFILTEPKEPVFVAGVGMAEIAAGVARAVKAKKPQLVVLAGFAGAYDRSALQRGDVVEVVTECIAGIPERYDHIYETTAPDTGLPVVQGITVNRSGDGTGESTASGELPSIENMEGAAFFAVCEALGVAGCEIRAVSNYVGEPFEEWATEVASANLTKTLVEIFPAEAKK